MTTSISWPYLILLKKKDTTMRLVVISGRSGAGKSTALNVLEDVGFTCIDNLPSALLSSLVTELSNSENAATLRLAVGIDARILPSELDRLPVILKELKETGVEYEVIFLDARASTIVRRFSETRRKHPLSNDQIELKEAIQIERDLLVPIASIADRLIDTTNTTLHQLRDLIKKQIAPTSIDMKILFESFGFKLGVPADVDFVFDVRCLPNPYWVHELRSFNGRDQKIIDFLEQHGEVAAMLADITGYLERWLPKFQASNRSYLTIGIGCTGGQHRSVYMCEKLAAYFDNKHSNTVQSRHREIDNWPSF
jgi:UPF0042 nucleotide-binding protein